MSVPTTDHTICCSYRPWLFMRSTVRPATDNTRGAHPEPVRAPGDGALAQGRADHVGPVRDDAVRAEGRQAPRGGRVVHGPGEDLHRAVRTVERVDRRDVVGRERAVIGVDLVGEP